MMLASWLRERFTRGAHSIGTKPVSHHLRLRSSVRDWSVMRICPGVASVNDPLITAATSSAVVIDKLLTETPYDTELIAPSGGAVVSQDHGDVSPNNLKFLRTRNQHLLRPGCLYATTIL